MASLQIVIDAINNASSEIGTVKDDINGIGESAEEMGNKAATAAPKTEDLLGKLAEGLGAAGLVVGVLKVAKDGFDKLVDIAEPAAQLDAVKTKFENLSTAIGTTADLLLGDLRTATSGMSTDAALVTGAAELIASGIATTKTEVVTFIGLADDLGVSVSDLVTTLTTQSTSKFDEMGISTIGFKDRVNELKQAGLDTEEAFGQAFLEYARTALENSGSAADTAKGSFDRYRTAVDNLKMALAEGLLPVLAPVLEGLASIVNWMITAPEPALANGVTALTQAMADGILTAPEYNALMGDLSNGYITNGDAVQYVTDKKNGLTQANGDLAQAQSDEIMQLFNGTTTWAGFQQAMDAAGISLGMMDEATWNAAKAEAALNPEAYGAAGALDAVTSAADGAAGSQVAVFDATNNAEAAMRTYTEALLFQIASQGLSAEGAYALADSMGLIDHNTVGATEQVGVYKDMLDKGMITQGEYNQLVTNLGTEIENLPDGKTIEVETDTEVVMQKLADIQAQNFTEKIAKVKYEVDDSAVGNYRPPSKSGTVTYNPVGQGTYAVGGSVNAGQPYTWQEYGYRGEVFVPSADGFVLSRADAERALARALYGGGSAVDPAAIGKAVAQAMSGVTAKGKGGNVYNLTMPTSSNPADVRTAFELMEAWGA